MTSSNQNSSSEAKRFRMSSDLSDAFGNMFTSYWPSFITITGNNYDFESLSIIRIHDILEDLIGPVESGRRLRSGSVLVQTRTKVQSEKLLNTTMLDDVSITAEPHKTLNHCRGTIISRESYRSSDEELTRWLNKKNIDLVRRIDLKKKFPTQKHQLQILILSFPGKNLPNKINIGFEMCKVKPYIPNPQRCFKCQKFGHVISKCRGQERCSNCAEIDHVHTPEQPCHRPPKCANCGETHPAFDRNCAKFAVEKEVQRLKVTYDISFPEARRMATQTNGTATYSNIAAMSPRQRATPRRKVQLEQHSISRTDAAPEDSSLSGTTATPTDSSPSGTTITPSDTNLTPRDHFVRLFEHMEDRNFAPPQQPTQKNHNQNSATNMESNNHEDSMDTSTPQTQSTPQNPSPPRVGKQGSNAPPRSPANKDLQANQLPKTSSSTSSSSSTSKSSKGQTNHKPGRSINRTNFDPKSTRKK